VDDRASKLTDNAQGADLVAVGNHGADRHSREAVAAMMRYAKITDFSSGTPRPSVILPSRRPG
jgi:hypothetical protein